MKILFIQFWTCKLLNKSNGDVLFLFHIICPGIALLQLAYVCVCAFIATYKSVLIEDIYRPTKLHTGKTHIVIRFSSSIRMRKFKRENKLGYPKSAK